MKKPNCVCGHILKEHTGYGYFCLICRIVDLKPDKCSGYFPNEMPKLRLDKVRI